MRKLKILTLITTLTFTCSQTWAFISPVSVSIFPPVQFPSSEFSITGARISLLWGQHRDVHGIDLGIGGNITENAFNGIGISGLFNYTKGNTLALGTQFAGLANINTNKTDVVGVQFAIGTNYNIGASSVTGLQFALVNQSAYTTIYGLQVGIYNKAQTVYGFQIGLVNSCTDLHGIQIGLINFHDKGLFVVSPILNVGF